MSATIYSIPASEGFELLDFILTWWKAISIAVTSGFGILGLLTRNTTEDGKLTDWGKFSFAGILISAIFGIAAQIKEDFDKRTAQKAAAEQTLAIVEKTQLAATNTQLAVKNIERLLEPINEAPSLYGMFDLSCDSANYKDICSALKPDSNDTFGNDSPPLQSHPAAATPRIILRIQISSPKNNDTNKKWMLKYDVSAHAPANKMYDALYTLPLNTFSTGYGIGGTVLALNVASPTTNENGSAFQSIHDLEGSLVTIYCGADIGDPLNHLPLKPTLVSLHFHNGRTLKIRPSSLGMATIHLSQD